ncbi:MAG: hypothetical protein HC824_08705 [Synechococcales cyanobacterium RM1_1_8]|nr:hypothetical protein [Synechococcales cyanobacterium RM1_1_8]
MSVTLGDEKLKYWALSRETGSANADSTSLIRRELATAQVITPGTKLELFGLEKDGDTAAIDSIEFVPVDLSSRPGRLEFSEAGYSFNESGLLGNSVTIQRIAGYGGTVSTTLSLLGDTAQAGSDFVGDPITVTFAPGETVKTIAIPLLNDDQPESTERFTLQLGQPTGGASLGQITSAQVILVDDEQSLEPRLFINGTKIVEIKAAIQVPGSHHQIAFAAMQARVDQNDWRVYDETSAMAISTTPAAGWRGKPR